MKHKSPNDVWPASPVTMGRKMCLEALFMSQVRCPACGAENETGAQYCRQCARRLDAKTEERVTHQRSTAIATQATGIRWTAVFLVILVVAAMAVLVVFLLIR